VFFIHNVGNTEYKFEEFEESLGTKKIFFLLWPIFDVIKNNKILIIDEMDSSLHPDLLRLIILLFYGKMNKNAQLIFTSHALTVILDNELFRKDQVYFTDRTQTQETELYSLVDFVKMHSNPLFAYLVGKLGAKPLIDKRIADDFNA